MTNSALRTLAHRSERLKRILRSGTHTEIGAARELLRLSLVELYDLGHWQSQPNDLQNHMQIYRAAHSTALQSTSAPDRMGRYNP